MNLSGKKIRKVCKMPSSYISSLGSCGKSLVYEHTDSNQERVYTRLSKQGKRLGDLDPNDTITSTYTSADSSYDCGVDNKSYYVTGGKVLCTDYDTDKTTTLVRYDSLIITGFKAFRCLAMSWLFAVTDRNISRNIITWVRRVIFI